MEIKFNKTPQRPQLKTMRQEKKILLIITITAFTPVLAAAVFYQSYTILLTVLLVCAALTVGVSNHFLPQIKTFREQVQQQKASVSSPPPNFEELLIESNNQTGQLLNKRQKIQQEVESKEVTVVLTDLRGFTSITQAYSALEVVDMLNRYFTIMCEIIYRHNGVVDKFIGDSIMALFGAPTSSEKDVINAISCAIEMQQAMNTFNKGNREKNIPNQYMGIGINTGQVIAGEIGSALHSEYTVVGDEINMTSRIEAYTLRGQILISNNTFQHVKDIVTVGEPVHISVKGKRDPLCIYELQAINAPINLTVPEREDRKNRRIEVNIPFKFQICIGKIVSPDTHEGRIRNISIGGILIYTLMEVEPHWNLKFRLSPEITGSDGDDIYGKVIRVKKAGELYEANIEFTAINSKDSNAIKELVYRTIESPLHIPS